MTCVAPPVDADGGERRHGRLTRQLFLGDGMDVDRVEASYDRGVVTLVVAVAEQAKPRRVQVQSTNDKEPIDADAEATVDRLADDGFPVEHVAIVGCDLRYVEQVTGDLNAWKAALSGAGLSGPRNFASITGMQAERFDVVVDAAFADDALGRLAGRATVPDAAN